jgi:4-hydroxy-tetrahydrodipicolinate reductase
MGSEVCRLVAEQEDMKLLGGVEAKGHPSVGTKLGSGVVGTDLSAVIADATNIVDFSTAEAMIGHCRLAALAGKGFITGVTGLSATQTNALQEFGQRIPIVYAANFSVGVSVLCTLVAEAASRLGPDYDVEVIEIHHRMKKDAPSGTATRLVDILAAGAGRARVVHGRQGVVGEKPRYEIGVSSIRTGGVVGEHTVVFGSAGERIELTHKAESRAALAAGVVAAIRFLKTRAPGFYSIEDVLASPR